METDNNKIADDKIIKAFSAEISISDDEPRAVVARISTDAVDRDGEVVLPQGCNSKDFEKNPIVYLEHNYWDMPMGQCVAFKRDEKGIIAKTVFAERPSDYPADEKWMPDVILSLYKQKVMRGFSVGFQSKESRAASEKDIEAYGPSCRRVYTKWTLLEYSCCGMPSNQEALVLAVSKSWKEKRKAEDAKDKQPLYGSELIVEPKRIVHYRRAGKAMAGHAAAVDRVIEKRKGFIYSRH